MHGQAFNFSNEEPRTVLEVVGQILALVGRPDPQLVVRGKAPNEIQDPYLDATRARPELGWTPLYTLEQGLQQTVAWYRRLLQEPVHSANVAAR